MKKVIFEIFLILHGLVHLLYLAISQKYINDDGIHWTGESWLLSSNFSETTVKKLAFLLYALAIILFILAGITVTINFNFANLIIYIASVVSTIVILIFWNGKLNQLADQGFVGVAINFAILIITWIFPDYVGIQ